jgi:hypothetical protein
MVRGWFTVLIGSLLLVPVLGCPGQATSLADPSAPGPHPTVEFTGVE